VSVRYFAIFWLLVGDGSQWSRLFDSERVRLVMTEKVGNYMLSVGKSGLSCDSAQSQWTVNELGQHTTMVKGE
jgi:hypothetical protein